MKSRIVPFKKIVLVIAFNIKKNGFFLTSQIQNERGSSLIILLLGVVLLASFGLSGSIAVSRLRMTIEKQYSLDREVYSRSLFVVTKLNEIERMNIEISYYRKLSLIKGTILPDGLTEELIRINLLKLEAQQIKILSELQRLDYFMPYQWILPDLIGPREMIKQSNFSSLLKRNGKLYSMVGFVFKTNWSAEWTYLKTMDLE